MLSRYLRCGLLGFLFLAVFPIQYADASPEWVRHTSRDIHRRIGDLRLKVQAYEHNWGVLNDLEKLETTLAKRMDRMSDVQSNLIERVETLESQSPVAFA